jgi:hypothetical protein
MLEMSLDFDRRIWDSELRPYQRRTSMHIPEITTEVKVQKLIAELQSDLASIERQEKLKIIAKDEAMSIRRSIQQSIDDLRNVSASKKG